MSGPVDILQSLTFFFIRLVDTVNMESKSAKKNKKRHNKKKPEFQGGAKEKSDTSPEYLLEALKEKLIEAKASQVWCTTLFYFI